MLHGSGILDQEGPISPEISPSPAVRTFNSIWLAYTVFAFFLHFISECKNRPFTHWLSFSNEYLWKAYDVPGMILGTEVTVLNSTQAVSPSMELTVDHL